MKYYYKKSKFSCLNCEDGCCRHFEVALEEKEALRFGKHASRKANGNAFLPKDSSGNCPFLDGKLCALHRDMGYDAKPLSCRVFPWHIQCWADGENSAELRYICPGVGAPEASEKDIFPEKALDRLAAEIRSSRSDFDSVQYSADNPAGLKQIRAVHEGIKRILFDENYNLALRFFTAAKIIDFHSGKSEFETIVNADEKFADGAVEFFTKASGLLQAQLDSLNTAAYPRSCFRNLLCYFVRNDSPHEKRLRRAWIQLKILLGVETLAAFNPIAPRCGVFELQKASQIPYTPEAEALFNDFMHSKIESMHFCGRMVHNFSYQTGLRFALGALCAVRKLALGYALASDSPRIEREMMHRAIFLVDFTFARSKVFEMRSAIRWIETLGRAENIGYFAK